MGVICVPADVPVRPARPEADTLVDLFSRSNGKRIVLILETFPFFMVGRLVGMGPGTIAVRAEEGVSIEFVGRRFHILVDTIAVFFIEEPDYPIPSLSSIPPTPGLRASEATADRSTSDDDVDPRYNLLQLVGQTLLFVLRPEQLAILGQTFRPICVATLEVAAADYVRLSTVNIRWSSAPEWVFPTPLFVPNAQIAVFLQFSRDIRFPLAQ